MNKFTIGQRWISELELGLGLGIVKKIENRRVEIYYPAADCTRLYAISSAPLKRVAFKPGDTIESRDGYVFVVNSLSFNDELILYSGENILLPESDLKDTLNFKSPEERFHHQIFDKHQDFNIRLRALQFQHRMLISPVRGFIGARIDLIPHQLYIAETVCSRYSRRVLLSDETGLGKTIEACLILHRLLLGGRIKRVLILVPDSLVLQWFVELLRRFNLIFKIFDKEYIESLNTTSYTDNIFLEHQLCLCSIDLLSSDELLQKLSIDARWDMVVIDEAHHLLEGSREYALAKNLGEKSEGMLLLTATPEQFGYRSHYARLRLLDPQRYYDYNQFLKEEEQYLLMAAEIDKIVRKEPLAESDREVLKIHTIDSSLDIDITNKTLEDLLDRFGPGRAIFQNSRNVMTGFPERLAHLIPLAASTEDLINQSKEFEIDQDSETMERQFNFIQDKRILWLVSFLKDFKSEKILLICRSKEKAKAIEENLKNFLRIETSLFHEDLTLLQRDKNASRFADDNGARILICSEIGSEGRNFQFAHHLVLFDLPLNPELLEQRIGRLDRIGQKDKIHIHIPVISGSEYEILAKWYHEGLNAFIQNIPGVYGIYQYFEKNLGDILYSKDFEKLNQLIESASQYCLEVAQRNRNGKDHLLALNSFRPELARHLIMQIQGVEQTSDTEDFMNEIFELYGIEAEPMTEKTYRLNLSLLSTEEFPLPVLNKDDLTVTFDRKTALAHENMEFLSLDHPMVSDVLEFLLSSERGNCSIGSLTRALLKTPQNNPANPVIFLETVFILECIAPGTFQMNRFLPPTPMRIIVNHLNQNCEKNYSIEYMSRNVKECFVPQIMGTSEFKKTIFPSMLQKCNLLAGEKFTKIKHTAVTTIKNEMDNELNRITKLSEVNSNIDQKEIIALAREKELLSQAVLNSRIRLDSLRVIFSDDLFS